MHHHSYFLPELARIEQDEFRYTLSEIVGHALVVPLDTHNIYAEGNMASISLTVTIYIFPTVTIYISRTPSNIENVYIIADCSPKEILIYTELFKEF